MGTNLTCQIIQPGDLVYCDDPEYVDFVLVITINYVGIHPELGPYSNYEGLIAEGKIITCYWWHEKAPDNNGWKRRKLCQ